MIFVGSSVQALLQCLPQLRIEGTIVGRLMTRMAEVLEGLDYEAAGQGLLPSVEVEHWVRRQIAEIRAGEFESPLADAVHAAAPVEDRMHMSHH